MICLMIVLCYAVHSYLRNHLLLQSITYLYLNHSTTYLSHSFDIHKSNLSLFPLLIKSLKPILFLECPKYILIYNSINKSEVIIYKNCNRNGAKHFRLAARQTRTKRCDSVQVEDSQIEARCYIKQERFPIA